MTRSKSTKRALSASVLSVVLCCALLIGGTFAWFTDSVTSGRNTITAGNLDVELEYRAADGSWQPVDGNTELFDSDALWEPGYTQTVYLKVTNAGTLALKYSLMVNVAGETEGTNVNGGDFKLSDYLVFGQVESKSEISKFETREAAWDAVGAAAQGLKDYTHKLELLKPDETEYIALVVYMPTSVGNEANYRSEAVPSIELGLNLFATQTPYEEDGFGSDYDKIDEWDGTSDTSWYNSSSNEFSLSSAEQLAGLAELVTQGNNFQGKTITLDTHVDLQGVEWTPIGGATPFRGTFNGNGKTVSHLAINSAANNAGFFGYVIGGTIQNLTISDADVKTTGNGAGILAGRIVGGSVSDVEVSGSVEGNYYTGGVVGCVVTSDVRIENCVNHADINGGQQVGGIVGTAYNANGTTVIANCVNYGSVSDKSGYGAGGIVGFLSGYGNSRDHKAPTVENCTNYGAIKGQDRAGGIGGALGIEGGMGYYNLTATFTNCQNYGSVSGTTTHDICGAKVNYSGADTSNLTIVIN